MDDLDIPDSFTVEADVTDYEKVEAVTVATNEVFNEVGTDKFDSLDELKDSMTELQDASNKLVRWLRRTERRTGYTAFFIRNTGKRN
ncbi:MAG: hypothetical protein ACLTX6_07500 [Lachnospiraceae bacterium]